jgi:outer membrane protein assembly factor BamB
MQNMSAENIHTQPAGKILPVLPGAPWPLFRRDSRNTGRLPLPGVYNGGEPWCFKTGKGIFSTPVIDELGRAYIGSADQFFYCLEADGSLVWKYPTRGVIDSAAALTAPDPKFAQPAAVTFLSGDGRMIRLRLDEDPAYTQDRLLWTFEAELRPGVSFNNWWEGNVAVGYDGTLYAGNTNFNYYAVSPAGQKRWAYATGSNNWSMAALGEDGTIYWGSNDTFVHAVDPGGRRLWKRRTLGFIAASAAVGSDGTVYIGSFDSNFYALDPRRGKVKWKFQTDEHIYSSAALGENPDGTTRGIYFGSADGCLYALDPAGRLIWRFDSGAPVRSSPAIGLDEHGNEIIYFGSGNGRIYALNADGSLRWVFNTTPDDPHLADRNDLNGSPALGEHGLFIGGEHGHLWYVPYDYPLNNPDDPRVSTGTDPLPRNYHGVLPVTPGAVVLPEFPKEVSPTSILVLRLVVREEGETVPARLCNNPVYCPPGALEIALDPPLPHRIERSADGRLIYIIPQSLLPPNTNFTLKVSGVFYTGGLRIGNLALGGRRAGQFASTFNFQTENQANTWLPLATAPQAVSALVWKRLTAALPAMLPSLNQVGFDAMEWIIGTALVTPPDPEGAGNLVLWAIAGRPESSGLLNSDPSAGIAVALSGTYQRDAFLVCSNNFELPITGIRVPFKHFELRGRLNPDLSIQPGAVAYAETDVLTIPNFGLKMVLAGLANDWYKKLVVIGTYQTEPYPDYNTAHRLPEGIRVDQLTFQPPGFIRDGWIDAQFALSPGASYPSSQHQAGFIIIDPQKANALPLNLHADLRVRDDSAGNLLGVRLRLPRGLKLPRRFLVLVMLDVFPLHREFLFLP